MEGKTSKLSDASTFLNKSSASKVNKTSETDEKIEGCDFFGSSNDLWFDLWKFAYVTYTMWTWARLNTENHLFELETPNLVCIWYVIWVLNYEENRIDVEKIDAIHF